MGNGRGNASGIGTVRVDGLWKLSEEEQIKLAWEEIEEAVHNRDIGMLEQLLYIVQDEA